MLEFTLPWPQSKLSPNARVHWSTLAREKKAYRSACWLTALEQLRGWRPEVMEGPLLVELEFVPPNRRSYDRDNLIARMKSGLDGLADALRIDDKRFSTLTARVNAEQIGGLVRVRISKEPKQ
jgi:crossover junction endodeoxyribonuclease RusA